ncbi:Pectinesterase inhibitor [Corchorus olitorius]|uniref:Pectinesterase inhibitor n=1 Tax=Corchorus olitorius TaxID=93759 RepID=A0A1R3IC50_9ROSI|nr:Pectinesterase inhibitor [Corchorus olitorius]
MAIKFYTSFSLVFLAAAGTFLLSGQGAEARIFGNGLCRDSDYPMLCSKVLKGAEFLTDPKLATGIYIKALIDETNKAKLRAAAFGQDVKVKACVSRYEDAIDSLLKSLNNLKQNDAGSLMSNLSAVVSNYGSCADEFADAHQRSPFAATTKYNSRMASNCLALAGQIKY